jgi:uncharacterized protein
VFAGCHPEPPDTTGTVTVEPFHSTLVKDDYLLRIRLPPGYDADPMKRYPLVVQLDPTYVGLQEFKITAGLISQHAEEGSLPEAVVVGVDYPDPFTRERDYRPVVPPDPAFGGLGADLFYRVLREEILPHVESKLRTDPALRTLVGHSNGAVFGWYAALRHTPPEPPLFSGVLAADCGFDEVMFTFERWHAERSASLPLRFYSSRAVYNGAVQDIVFDAMVQRITSRKYEGLQFASEELETDHGGAVYPSFEAGLEHILAGQP